MKFITIDLGSNFSFVYTHNGKSQPATRVAPLPSAMGAVFGVWEGELGGDESVRVSVCLGLFVCGGEWGAPRKSVWSVELFFSKMNKWKRKWHEHVALHKFPSSGVWHRDSTHIVYGRDALRRKGVRDEDEARKGAKQEHVLRWTRVSAWSSWELWSMTGVIGLVPPWSLAQALFAPDCHWLQTTGCGKRGGGQNILVHAALA